MYQQREVAAILLAAGHSTRMGFDKMFYMVDGVEVFRLALSKLDTHPYIDKIVVVAGDNLDKITSLLGCHPSAKPCQIVRGGDSRAASVAAGLAACGDASLLVIHDAARPFVTKKVISRTIEAAAKVGAAAPAVPVKDTIKQAKSGMVTGTVPRHTIQAVQTPQVFDRAAYAAAFAALDPAAYDKITDDCQVMEQAGHPVRLVPGEPENSKITTVDDLPAARAGAVCMPRVGHGYDVHRFAPGRRLVLGGVDIEHWQGLLGHSDADVLLHAVADALLGAAALGDIGRHFPDSDPAFKGADSLVLLAKTAETVRAAGFVVLNLDATVVCQEPRLADHIEAMRRNIARALGVCEGLVSVKATTEEGLGFTGAEQGIAAHCVALLRSV